MSTYKIIAKPVFMRLQAGERRLILIFGDTIAAILALITALYFWGSRDQWLNFSIEFLRQRPQIWFYLLPLLWLVLMIELYDIRRASRRSDTLRGIGIAGAIYIGIYLILYFAFPPDSLPRIGVAVFIIAVSVLTIGWRYFYISVFTAPRFLRRVVIVGAGKAGTTLARVINSIHPTPFHLIGLIDDDPEKIGSNVEGYPVLGSCVDLSCVLRDQGISDIILAISGKMQSEMFQALLKAEEEGIELTTASSVYEDLLGRVPIDLLPQDWILRSFVDQAHSSGLYEVGKRALDILGGFVGVIGLLVVYPFISLAILLDTGSPVLFLQSRLGKNGRSYKIIKFRTMRQDAEKDGKARVTIINDDRITRVGSILRKSHLDELPQFLNVLQGDMSLVGPRAERSELVEELQRKVTFYRARLLVKPGITGWAQINFGYAATVEETAIKLEYDLYYIMHRGMLMDINILLRTVGNVIRLRGQ
jgi:exopolysaccharide biosynthesis polyprenyl glycosylphosphotransferase